MLSFNGCSRIGQMGSLSLVVLAVVLFLNRADASQAPERQSQLQHASLPELEQTMLQEDISDPSVKSAFVSKFEQAKKQHSAKLRKQKKMSRSHDKLSIKNKQEDELTGSGHKASQAPEDEAGKFMNMLPWVLPIVCVSILVLVGIGAKMCQAGNYKHTAALTAHGVQPTFKYGGPIGAGPM